MSRAFLLLAALILFTTGCSPEPEVFHAYFGSFENVGSGKVTFLQTNKLSRKSEVNYGWAVTLTNKPSEIAVTEEIESPVSGQWNIPANSKNLKVSSDGKTVSATQTIPLDGKTFLFHNWALSNTDSLGTYKATLYVKGKKISEINFSVTE